MGEKRDLTKAWIAVAALATAGGLAFYEWLLFTRWGLLEKWGALGSALGPVAALFSAGAVLAALWSVRLQRHELALQRRALAGQQAEIDRHMDLLEAQRAEFVRSADAHERLAKSQDRLAAAQDEAVTAAAVARLVQHSATIAALEAALTQIEIQQAVLRMSGADRAFGESMAARVASLNERRTEEVRAEKLLLELLHKRRA